MRAACVTLLVPMFLGMILIAHPAVAGTMTDRDDGIPPVAQTTAAPQLPTINPALTQPLPAIVYARDGGGGGGGGVSEDVEEYVSARIALLKANQAIGFGILGLFSGPVLILIGLNFILSLILIPTGLIFLIWGLGWLLISLPVFIGGLIGAGVSRARMDAAAEGVSLRPAEGPDQRTLLIPVFQF